MALWGNSDSIYSTGTITSVSGVTVTGNGTTWTQGNGVVPGLVITFGTANGSGVIKSVNSATSITLDSDADVQGTVASGTKYNISAQPVYLPVDSNYNGSEIFGVDETEQENANAASGFAREIAPPHAGWVGVSTYTDMHGSLRVKTETFVASSSITSDSTVPMGDDAKFTP